MNFEDLFHDTTAAAASPGFPPGDGPCRMRARRPDREKVVLAVTGPLDLASIDRFTELLHERLRATTPTLVLDLSGVTFLGGAAIEALLHAEHHARTTNRELVLVTGTHAVDRALQALELTNRFTYGDQPAFDTEEAAAHAAPTEAAFPARRAAPEAVSIESRSYTALSP